MAKKNNPQDKQIEEMLHKVLGRYQEILFKAANAKKDEDLYAYKERFIKELKNGSYGFKEQARKVVNDYIPNFEIPTSTLLQSFGARYGGEEIKLTTYVRMVDTLTLSMDQYRIRIDEQIRDRERQGKVTTVMDLQDIVNQDLRDDNVTVVRYANGTSVPVDKYAAMLARTTRAETENLSMIQQALREGIDLVECDIVSPTCDSCAVHQGRVYSISGNDSRYPALYKTAFKSGYSIIHPNCRHSWSLYHVELYSEEERRQALERSNRTWKPDGDGRVFQQTERARAEYSKGQQLMRQWNAEIVEYERMKAYYAEQGQEPPYKTLGAFRRAKRANAETYQKHKEVWRLEEQKSSKPREKTKISLTTETETVIIKEVGLQDKKTGEVVSVETRIVQPSELQQIDKSGDFQFSWLKIKRDNPNCTIAAVSVEESDTIEGLVAYEVVESDNAFRIHNIEKTIRSRGVDGQYEGMTKVLFAYVAKIALEKGYDLLEFTAKTKLVEYYQETLGAHVALGQNMYLTEIQMKKLVDEYYPKGADDEKK